MSEFMNPRLASLEAYVPGEQPQDRTYIKLNTNESPYAPSKGVRKALDRKKIDSLRLYCDPNAFESGTGKAVRQKTVGNFCFQRLG